MQTERRVLTNAAAYELVLISTAPDLPVVHLRFLGHRPSIVLTVDELEAFYADVGQLLRALHQEGVRRPDPSPSA